MVATRANQVSDVTPMETDPVPAGVGATNACAAGPSVGHPTQPIMAGSGNADSGVPIVAGPENGHPNVLSVLSSLVGSNSTPAEATELVDKLTMLVRAANGSTVRTNSYRLALPEFSGNDDLSAHILSSDKYLEMLEWLRACEFTLRTSDVREADYAVILLKCEAGADREGWLPGSNEASGFEGWEAGLLPGTEDSEACADSGWGDLGC
jgi:hypothetical protein